MQSQSSNGRMMPHMERKSKEPEGLLKKRTRRSFSLCTKTHENKFGNQRMDASLPPYSTRFTFPTPITRRPLAPFYPSQKFWKFWKKRVTDRWMDWRTYERTYGVPYGRTDRPSYRGRIWREESALSARVREYRKKMNFRKPLVFSHSPLWKTNPWARSWEGRGEERKRKTELKWEEQEG